jgi:hypothetical protein
VISFGEPAPLQDAVDSLGKRTPLGAMLSSQEWERVPREIKKVSFWAARVTEEQILAEMQRRLLQAVKQERDGLSPAGRLMDRGRFVIEMQDVLRRAGYQPDPDKRGGLQDLSSSRRLSLIWEMQMAMARGHAADKARKSEVALKRAPAQELIRGMQRRHERQWPQIWREHGGTFYGKPGDNPDYPDAPGRMIALVTDPIWRAISRFDLPFPPLDWGSGMVLKSIRRREAMELGVVKPADPEQDAPPPMAFGEGMRMSIAGLGEDALERLRSDLGDAVRFDGKQAVFHTVTTSGDSHEQQNTEIREALRARARSAFERGEAILGRLRREEDAAQALFDGDQAASVRHAYLAQLAAVSNGRKRLFHENISEADARPLIEAAKELDDGVRAEWKDGHLVVWREDLIGESLDELVALSGENPEARNGLLLGYGLPSMAGPDEDHAIVLIKDPDGDTVSGFHAPLATARTFAEARTRDFTEATGEEFTFHILPRKGGLR